MNSVGKADKNSKVAVIKSFLPILIFSAVVLSVCFYLGRLGILEGTEGEFASISRKMADTGDWLTPRINGFKVFSERPASYWIGAASIKIFGANEFAFRLPLAFAAGISAICVFFIGRMFFGTLTGLLSVMVFWSSLFFQFSFRIFTAEPFFMAAELVLAWMFFSYLNRPSKKFKYLFWLALSVAFLFKGTLSFIPLFGLISAALYTEQRFSIKQLAGFWQGWLIFIVFGLGWHIGVAIENPGSWMYLIANEFFYTTIINQTGSFSYPFYLYFILVPIMLFPWIGCFIAAIWEQSKEFKDAPTASYMLLWIAVPFVFFTICSLKNPGFMLQIMAPLSIISAECIRRSFFEHSKEGEKEALKLSRWHCIVVSALTALFGIVLSFMGYKVSQSAVLIGQIGIFGGIFWLFSALIIIAFILKGSRRGVLIIIASIVPGFLLFVFPYVYGYEPWKDGQNLPSKVSLITLLKDNLPRSQELIFVDDMLDSWYFYTGKDIQACGIKTDSARLRGLIPDENSKSILTMDEAIKSLKPDSIMIMHKASVERIQNYVGKPLYDRAVANENDWVAVQTIKPVSD